MRWKLRAPLRVPRLNATIAAAGDVAFVPASFLWDAPAAGETPTSYEIYWGTATGVHGSGPLVDAGFDRQELLSGISPSADVTYYVVVRAKNAAGLGPKSNEIQVRNGVQIA